jgi:hypothetical protein
MKRILLLLAITLLAIGCTPEKSESSYEEYVNPMVGTQWEAPDEISTLIWGTSISRLEFLDNTQFQDITVTKGSVKSVDKGSYYYSNNRITLRYPKYFSDGTDRTVNCEVSGSIMTTDRPNLYSGNMTYQKTR